MIKKSALPHNLILKELSTTQDVKTLAGRLTAHQVVTLWDIRLPDFWQNHQISQQKALVFDHNDCKYDIIFGTNFLSKVGIKLNYDTALMEWYDVTLPVHSQQGIDSKEFNAMEDSNIQLEDELFGEDWLQCYATHILDARYEFTDVKDVIDQLTYLNTQQKAYLLQNLMENAQMFDGTLGVYPHKKVHWPKPLAGRKI